MAEPRLLRPTAQATLTAAPPDQRAVAPGASGLLRFTIARRSDNELVLFDIAAQEGWIVYPPRSSYEFLRTRRASSGDTVVEHHPWAPFSKIEDHLVRAASACAQHGTACTANEIIQAAANLGFNPFV